MRPLARTELPALREPAVRALVLHVRAGGLGLTAGRRVQRSCPSFSTSWDLALHDPLAAGASLPTRAPVAQRSSFALRPLLTTLDLRV